MKIQVTYIEADARELHESNSLASNFAAMISRCFASTMPFDADPAPEPAEAGEE